MTLPHGQQLALLIVHGNPAAGRYARTFASNVAVPTAEDYCALAMRGLARLVGGDQLALTPRGLCVAAALARQAHTWFAADALGAADNDIATREVTA